MPLAGGVRGEKPHIAGVVELVDTLDLGSSGASLGGSTPFARTIDRTPSDWAFRCGRPSKRAPLGWIASVGFVGFLQSREQDAGHQNQ